MSSGVGLFGGSFNPIHIGHLIIGRAVAERLNLGRVILIPSAKPPHKQDADLAGAAHRLEMVRLAVSGDPCFEVSDIEVMRQGPSYTFDTVRAYRDLLGAEAAICWMIGSDSLPELHLWYRIEELVKLCRIVTAARPGFETPNLQPLMEKLTLPQIQQLRADVLPTPRIDISATQIRQRIREGRSIRYLVPERVQAYIDEHKLYANLR